MTIKQTRALGIRLGMSMVASHSGNAGKIYSKAAMRDRFFTMGRAARGRESSNVLAPLVRVRALELNVPEHVHTC
jgi:hypothetical protein